MSLKAIINHLEDGECLETIQEYTPSKELKRYHHIHSLWEKYSNLRVELIRALYNEYEKELDDE